eukprot:5564326-Pyramimonas_sp.AAC.1
MPIKKHMNNVITDADADEPQFATDDRQAREEIGLGIDEAPWTGRAGVSLRGMPDTVRVRKIIDVLFARACREHGISWDSTDPCLINRVTRDFFCDPSQTLKWARISGKRVTTQTTKSYKYSYEIDKALIAADTRGLFGYPHNMLDCMGETGS